MSLTPAQQALTEALQAEYAAIYAYGLVAAYSKPDRQAMIAASVAAHRARRDELVRMLSERSVPVAPAPAGYTAPFAVDDPIPAAKLAVAVENDAATAWLAAVERVDNDTDRRTAIDALVDTSVRLATWNAIVPVSPPTTPFPGKP